MNIDFTKFTFDPDNQINISQLFLEHFGNFIEKELTNKHPEIDKSNPGWTLTIFISSDSNFRDELKINPKVRILKKNKNFEHYAYFPVPVTILKNEAYPLDEFIQHFFKALDEILKNHYQIVLDPILLNHLILDAIKQFAKKKYWVVDQLTTVTENDLVEAFFDAPKQEIIDFFSEKTLEELRQLFPNKDW